MRYSLLMSGLLAMAANAQETTSSTSTSSASSSSSSVDSAISILSGLSGVSENPTPTGSYLSYSSTQTLSLPVTTSAISTVPVISLISTSGETETSTVGSTTLFATLTIMGGNTSTASTTTSTPSQIILQGQSHTSSTTLRNGTHFNSTATSTSTSAQPTNTTPCNNWPEFCERKYGNITEVAAHNSPFVRAGNAAANQALPVTTQLNDGIRLIQAQIQFVDNTPHFCHTSCEVLDAGPITEWLGAVYDWVSTHPYDVVTILFGNGGPDYHQAYQIAPFIEQTGLVQYAYTPPKIPMGINDWPTLASMILQGKRVVMFMDYNANQTAYPWLLDEFSQMWETPFDPTNRSFPCTQQRPPGLSVEQAKERLYLVNHNLNYDISLLGNSLLVPNIPLLNITNNVTGEGSLGVTAEMCHQMWNYTPKFLNVDYYNVGKGSVFEVAAHWNNVTYDRQCCGLTTSSANRREIMGRSAMLLALVVVAISWLASL